MGSLNSRPKAPIIQSKPLISHQPKQVVRQVVSKAKPIKISPPTSPKQKDKQISPPEIIITEIASDNISARDRSRLSTIKTGFRGLLNLAEIKGQKKSLLGE